MTKNKLEKIVGYSALVGVGLATMGELVYGAYDGYRGIGGYEGPPMILGGPILGYVSQLIAGEVLLEPNDEMQKSIAVPVVPIVSIVCYVTGYGIGNLLK